MKKLFKIILYFFLVVIALIIVLTVVAKLSENKIAAIALRKISAEIEAPVQINDVSLNLIRKFPLATIELNDIYVGAKGDTLNKDTIASIRNIYVSVKSRPLLNGEIDITKIHVDGANIYYLVDTSGATNIDFLMESNEDDVQETDTSASEPLNINLTDLSLENIICNYNDRSLGAKARVYIPELKVEAKLEGDNILAGVKGGITLSNCSFEETNLHLMQKTNVDFDLDYENDSVNIKQLIVKTDGANLDLAGSVVLGESIKTNIKLLATDLNLDELIKYAPEEILNENGVQKVSGLLTIEAFVNGIYAENQLPKVDAKISFKDGHVVTKDYPELKNILFRAEATNGILQNNKSTQLIVPEFKFETAQSKFRFNFSVLDIDKPKYKFNSDFDINIAEFGSFIPDTLLNYIDGKIVANISTKGELPDSIRDEFIDDVMANSKANISLNDLNVRVDSSLAVNNFSGVFSYKPNNFTINNLKLNVPTYKLELENTSLDVDFYGSINNTSKLRLDLKSYHIETKGSSVSGNAKVKNLDNPDYEFESKIVTNLAEAKVMLPDSLLKELSGNVEINVRSKAKLKMDSLESQMMEIVFKNSSYDVSLQNINAEPYDEASYKIENFSGFVSMNPDAIQINKMQGSVAGLDFVIDSTEIWNVYPVVIQENKDEILTVQTKINLGKIDNKLLAMFMPADTSVSAAENQTASAENVSNENNTENIDTIPGNLLPDLSEMGIPHFLVRGSLSIDNVEYEKNYIDDISLLFRFTDSLYVVDQFKLKTCGGELNTSFKLDARNWEKPVIDIKNYITSLDVKELLIRNDNFGDTSITHEKINGILTSEMHVRVFYENGEFPTERIRAEGHFKLEDGKIYGYEPLVELSKNKIIGGLKELDKLDFNTLETSLFMYKDKIYIPKTTVETSSMDLTAFAMHSLKGDYEYHLEVHLGDVFTGKSEDLMKKQDKHFKQEGESFERSGGLRLVSSEYDGKSKNGFDSPKKEKEFLKDLNKQKGWLRLFFNPLLVNFSTDLDRTAKHQELIEKYGSDKEN